MFQRKKWTFYSKTVTGEPEGMILGVRWGGGEKKGTVNLGIRWEVGLRTVLFFFFWMTAVES